jgi:hypothetical protein
MMYKFSLTNDQIVKLDEWMKKQNADAVAAQRANPPDVPLPLLESCWEDGFPYGGAIGGGFTFSFTPTSIGVVVKVHNVMTDDVLDLTDWELW